jgi:WD40 repeat protein
MTQNILNEVKHRKVDLEQIKRDKEALEVKMGAEVCDEDLQRLGEFDGVISRHTKEIKKFEDWLTEKAPLSSLKRLNVNSVKLTMLVSSRSSVPLSFFSSGSIGMVSIGFLSLPSAGVCAEAVRLVEPVVEEVKVNKQLLADANKLMAYAHIKGMKAVASLAGHARAVFSVTFSPDGQHIVSGSSDNLVKVWSVSARKEVASLAGHTNFVSSVAFSPDGQYIVSGSGDDLVKVWSVSGGKEVASLDT